MLHLPRCCPQTYGVNAAASWGYQWRQPYATGKPPGWVLRQRVSGQWQQIVAVLLEPPCTTGTPVLVYVDGMHASKTLGI